MVGLFHLYIQKKEDKKRTWKYSITNKDKEKNKYDFSEKKRNSKNEIIETKNMTNIYITNIETDKNQKVKEDILSKNKYNNNIITDKKEVVNKGIIDKKERNMNDGNFNNNFGNANYSMILRNNNSSFMNEEFRNSNYNNNLNLTYQGNFNNYTFDENNKKSMELLNNMKNMINQIDTKLYDENGDLL